MSNHIIRDKSSKGQSRHVTRESRDGTKPTRYYSSKQEKDVANNLSGRRTSNSGATDFGGKSDVSVESLFNIECKTKTTHCESISIKKDWFIKNKEEAAFMGKAHTAIVFNFGPNEENHYIIDEYLFNTLLEYLNK